MDRYQKIIEILKTLFLPLGVLIDGLTIKERSVGKKILGVFVSLVIYFYWQNSILGVYNLAKWTIFEEGKYTSEIEIDVVGTSMLPTINDGSKVKLQSLVNHNLERGDVVSFSNENTDGINYLKRVIALPGEKILLKDGKVLVNSKQLSENYIYQSKGTYGNTFIPECREMQVPEDSYVVMGDNRLESWDSRAIGFVKKDSINGYKTVDSRPNLIDVDQSKTTTQSFKFDRVKFLNNLNKYRQDNSVGSLVNSSTLSDLATKRSQSIGKDLDKWKSFELPVDKELEAKGYRFNLVHEYVAFGNVDEESLIKQMADNPNIKNIMLSDKFWEVGVGFFDVADGDCNYPLLSVIFSWPVVPTYSSEVVKFWKEESVISAQLLNSLQSWVGTGVKNEAKLKEAINITAQSNEISTRLYKKMSTKQWLNNTDINDSNRYSKLAESIQPLLVELFPNVRGINSVTKPDLW